METREAQASRTSTRQRQHCSYFNQSAEYAFILTRSRMATLRHKEVSKTMRQHEIPSSNRIQCSKARGREIEQTKD